MYNNWRIIDISSIWGVSSENQTANSNCVSNLSMHSILKSLSHSTGPTALHSFPYQVARDISATLLKHLASSILQVLLCLLTAYTFILLHCF